jgi:hypothetical protein
MRLLTRIQAESPVRTNASRSRSVGISARSDAARAAISAVSAGTLTAFFLDEGLIPHSRAAYERFEIRLPLCWRDAAALYLKASPGPRRATDAERNVSDARMGLCGAV